MYSTMSKLMYMQCFACNSNFYNKQIYPNNLPICLW